MSNHNILHFTFYILHFRGKRSPRGVQEEPRGAQEESKRSPRGVQEEPRGVQEEQRGAQEEPKRSQEEPKRSPRGAQEEPKRSQEEPKRSQEEPKRSPRGAKRSPRGAKRSPRGAKRSPRGAQEEPRRSQGGAKKEPRRSQEGAKKEPRRARIYSPLWLTGSFCSSLVGLWVQLPPLVVASWHARLPGPLIPEQLPPPCAPPPRLRTQDLRQTPPRWLCRRWQHPSMHRPPQTPEIAWRSWRRAGWTTYLWAGKPLSFRGWNAVQEDFGWATVARSTGTWRLRELTKWRRKNSVLPTPCTCGHHANRCLARRTRSLGWPLPVWKPFRNLCHMAVASATAAAKRSRSQRKQLSADWQTVFISTPKTSRRRRRAPRTTGRRPGHRRRMAWSLSGG